MKNKALDRALASLVHPLALGTMALLLLNDHVLRRWWPSWWTGKLGDVAWLGFAPLAMAALLAFLIPPRLRERISSNDVGHAAFILTAGIFGLAKTLPLCHRLVVRILSMIVGGPVALQRDPMDLLALPALLLGWAIWKQTEPNADSQSKAQSRRRRPWGALALSLAALATLANTPPNFAYGITCLAEREASSEIIAVATYSGKGYPPGDVGPNAPTHAFISKDGGLSWATATISQSVPSLCGSSQRTVVLPGDERVRYRREDQAIARSENGGPWQPEITFTWSNARVTYYEKLPSEPTEFSPGPRDILAHEPTRHIVVAMGIEGVLVRTTDGQWHWVAVGPYQRPDLRQVTYVRRLLATELKMTLALGLLILGTLAQRGRGGAFYAMGWIYGGGLTLTLIGLGIVLIFQLVSYTTPESGMADIIWDTIVMFGQEIVLLLSVLLGIYGLARASLRLLGVSIGTAIGGMVAFFVPYLLWNWGIVPHYAYALAFAGLATMGVVGAGFLYVLVLREALPPAKPRARSILMTTGQGHDVVDISWSGWLWTTVAALAGGQLIGLLLFVKQAGFGRIFRLGLFSIQSPLIEGAIVGLALGCLQWIILMPLGKRARWWIPLTAVAVMLGEFAGHGLSRFVRPQILRAVNREVLSAPLGQFILSIVRSRMTMAGLIGGLVGGAQWFLIHRRFKRAGVWVLVNLAAWPLGVILGQAVQHLPIDIVFFIIGFFFSRYSEQIANAITFTLQSMAIGLSVGALTGWALLWLSQRE